MKTGGEGPQAIVLSGGGAYAAYEVGVMRALLLGDSPATDYAPVQPCVLTGTSAGAYNAAVLLSTGRDLAVAISNLENVWITQIGNTSASCSDSVLRFRFNPLSFSPTCLAADPLRPIREVAQDSAFVGRDWFNRGVEFLRSSEDLNQRVLELVDLGSFTSAAPMMQLIPNTVRLDEIRSSPVRLKIGVTNWRTGVVRFFENEQMTPDVGNLVILASASVPGLLHSVEIEGEPYVDAALVMNTPLKPAIDAGAETIHVIYLDPEVQSISLPRIRNTASEIYRTLVIGFAATLNRDIEIASRINLAVKLLDTGTRGLKAFDVDLQGFFLVADRISNLLSLYRKITIHRYHPQDASGGIFRWLSFGRDHVTQLIEQGFSDTVEHDCTKNRCVLAY